MSAREYLQQLADGAPVRSGPRHQRPIAAAGCGEAGHDWRPIGNANAACDDDCGCSVPLYECTVCGDSDCGDNPEGDQVRLNCERRESP